jgi:Sugar kinases, ribokinase family
MPILNFGSLNIDHVYRVDSFVQPGETKHSKAYMVNSGGKGLNQSIAAAKAGGRVLHAGLVGRDGGFLVEKLQAAGVDTALMQASAEVSGHAIIQVADSGQNCILLYGGTNQLLTESYVETALSAFWQGRLGFVAKRNQPDSSDYPKGGRKGFESGV